MFRWHKRTKGDFSEELRTHLDLEADRLREQGLGEEEARAAARRNLGNIRSIEERFYEASHWLWFDHLWQDLRYTSRQLRKDKGFTLTAVMTLALGIGANTAIFSIVDAVLLKYLPVERPQELLQVRIGQEDAFTNPLWEQLRDHQDVFSGVFAWSPRAFNLATGGEAHNAQGLLTSGDFFRTLGVHAILGRAFTPVDDQRGCPAGPVAVLSYAFWQSRYGGDGAVVGKKISLDAHPFEIIGVIQPGFYGVEVGQKFDVAAPICAEAIVDGGGGMMDERSSWWLRVIGRPRSGFSSKQVTARLKTLAPQIFQATVPPHWGLDLQRDYRRRTFEIKPAANGLGYLRTQYRAALITLMVVVGVVLLIACANIANLLLVRAAVRQKEIAVRLAIGAGRGRLIRQLLTESVVLSLMGASFGILFANWGSTLLVRYLSSRDNQVFLDLAISLRVLGFTAVVAVTTGILFGVAPAWRGTRVPLSAAMKGNTGGLSGGRARLGLGKALVVFQVALSLVLLVGAGLLAATFWKLATVDAGFDRENVLLVSVDLRNARYPNERLFGVYDEILDTLRTLPGVRSASYSRLTPVSGNWWNEWVRVDGYTPTSSDPPMVFFNRVSSRFFETLDTPLLAGRDFNTHDSKNSPPVAIVNETMAKKYFHGTNPIGKGFRIGEPDATPGKWTEIIGIAKDAKYRELRETIPPIAYVPMSQDPDSRVSNTYELRTTGAPSEAIAAVRTAFERMNKNIDLEFHTLALQVNESLSRERLLATLSGFFGALALLLASVGLYGVMSYTVASRRNEIGIRMALGAEQGRILWMVLREVLLLVAAGMAIGFATAAATTRLIASMLYGLEATDPSTMALAGTFLLGVAAVAGYLPACSAARLNPMITLREE